jgi:sterol desaturase/sphingolipid hydroxylase (fatty acid hydroxylase superfamily)
MTRDGILADRAHRPGRAQEMTTALEGTRGSSEAPRRLWIAVPIGALALYEATRVVVALLVGRSAARGLIGFDPHHLLESPWSPPAAGVLLSPILPLLACALVLQRLLPARTETDRSPAVGEDLCWLAFGLTLSVPLLQLEAHVLKSVYDAHLGFLTRDAVAALPRPVAVAIGLVVLDFAGYVTHVIRHHVQRLWRLHAVHHSQPRLNPFTHYRFHPVEYLFVRAVTYTALYAVGVDPVTAAGVQILLEVHALFQHSNIRTNLGPLRFILVTPQSHRIHHSSDPRHFDKNFGLYLSVWDHLFGTQHRVYDEYPETGIPDRRFPLVTSGRAPALLRTWVAQVVYPFRRLELT